MQINIDTSKLKAKFEENPLGWLAVGSIALSAVPKLINARANARNSKTWSREEKRRERKDAQR